MKPMIVLFALVIAGCAMTERSREYHRSVCAQRGLYYEDVVDLVTYSPWWGHCTDSIITIGRPQ